MSQYGVFVPQNRVHALPLYILAELDLSNLSWYTLTDLRATVHEIVNGSRPCDCRPGHVKCPYAVLILGKLSKRLTELATLAERHREGESLL